MKRRNLSWLLIVVLLGSVACENNHTRKLKEANHTLAHSLTLATSLTTRLHTAQKIDNKTAEAIYITLLKINQAGKEFTEILFAVEKTIDKPAKERLIAIAVQASNSIAALTSAGVLKFSSQEDEAAFLALVQTIASSLSLIQSVLREIK